jgi:hypothetical protein
LQPLEQRGVCQGSNGDHQQIGAVAQHCLAVIGHGALACHFRDEIGAVCEKVVQRFNNLDAGQPLTGNAAAAWTRERADDLDVVRHAVVAQRCEHILRNAAAADEAY